MKKIIASYIDIKKESNIGLESNGKILETEDGKKYIIRKDLCFDIARYDDYQKINERLKKIVSTYVEPIPRKEELIFATNHLDLCKLRLKDWKGEIIELEDGKKYAVCVENDVNEEYFNIDYVSICYDFEKKRWIPSPHY
jgi:hypothetical protein